jgi:hypothetical protein
MVKPGCGTLALLGNIGRPEHPKTYHLLNFCSKNWDTIYWIPGPHELTNHINGRMTYVEKVQNAKALCKQFSNVSLMDSKEAVFHKEKIVLLGTPLWSSIRLPPKGQPEFSSIFTSVDEAGQIPLCHHVRNHWHKLDSQYLSERSLFWNIVHPQIKIVYLTHTLPSPLLLRYPMSEDVMIRMRMDVVEPGVLLPPIAWIGGATGSTAQRKIGSDPKTQILAAVNSLYEYPFNHQKKPEYDPTSILEINTDDSPPVPQLTLPPLLSSLLLPKPFLAYA